MMITLVVKVLSHLSLDIKYFYGNNSMLAQNTFTKNCFESNCHTFPQQMLNPYFILQSIRVELKLSSLPQVLCKMRYFLQFRKIYRKTPVLKSCDGCEKNICYGRFWFLEIHFYHSKCFSVTENHAHIKGAYDESSWKCACFKLFI